MSINFKKKPFFVSISKYSGGKQWDSLHFNLKMKKKKLLCTLSSFHNCKVEKQFEAVREKTETNQINKTFWMFCSFEEWKKNKTKPKMNCVWNLYHVNPFQCLPFVQHHSHYDRSEFIFCFSFSRKCHGSV